MDGVFRRLVPILVALGGCSSSPDAGPASAPTPGRLVVIGGALSPDNASVYEAVMDGREGGGPVCVLPTASGVPEESMAGAVEALERYGGPGSATGVFVSTGNPEAARDPSVASELAGCSGFFFTGGVQSRVVDVFLPGGDTTAAYRAVRRRWEEGAVIAGTSAGAAMMARVMIAGGSSEAAVTHGVASGPDGEGVSLERGMGFFPGAHVDQHFLARGRIGRLLVAVVDPGSPPVGFGIDENTALVVDGGSATVLGASAVVVVDGRGARRTGPGRAEGIRVELAGAGDVVDLRTLQVRRPTAKRALRASGASADLDADPFARWAFVRHLAELASSAVSETTFTLADATLRVREGQRFSASVFSPEGGVQGLPAGLSAGPFVVDLVARGPSMPEFEP